MSEARAALNELVRANLLEERRSDRFWLHDLLRAYAAELAHDSERRDAEHRIIGYYLNASRLANARIQPCWDERDYEGSIADTYPAVTTYDRAMNWFTAEQATLRSVIEFTSQRESSIYIAELARGCVAFYARTGQRHERAAICHTVLAAARRDGWGFMQIKALCELARAVIRLGDFDERSVTWTGHSTSHNPATGKNRSLST
ncbi:MAG: hypothetical protein ACJ72N_17045 [Labedaea sp.]